jgi:phosphotransferase system enzyme I (PtsI)
MVTEISEVVLTRSILEECSLDLKKKKIKHEMPALGIMVETPGCALGLERYSESCDFFSVGTNDLLQYLMAVDRNNNNVSELYNPYHYSFLKVLQEIVVSSKKKKIPLSICGEIASDPNFTLLLLGLGFRSFSIALPLVKKVKKILSSVTIQESENLVKKIFKLSASEKYSEIESYLFNDHMQ